ncbi:unnamed protein product [Cunninghamella echinulata]
MKQNIFLSLWQRTIFTFLLLWGNMSILVIRNPLRKKTIQQFLYRSLLVTTFSLYCLNRDDFCNQLDTINDYSDDDTIVTGDVNGKTNLRYLEYNSLLFDSFVDDNSNAFSNNNSNLLDPLSYSHVIRQDSNYTWSEVSLNGIAYRIDRNTFNLIINCNMNGANVHLVVAKSNNSTLLTFTRGTERNIDLFKNLCMEWYVNEKTKWFEDDMYRRLNIRDKLAIISYGWHWSHDHNMQHNDSTMVINCDGASIAVVFNPESKTVPSYSRVLRPRAGWIA